MPAIEGRRVDAIGPAVHHIGSSDSYLSVIVSTLMLLARDLLRYRRTQWRSPKCTT